MAALLHSLVAAIVGSWFPVDTVSSPGLFDVQMVSTDTAFAVGRQGGILRSLDGGISWHRVGEGLTDSDLREVHFRNPREGMVLGQNLLARTEDGGVTWTRIASDTAFFHAFLEGNRSGRIFVQPAGGGMRSTDDLGRTWTVVGLRDSVRVGDWNAMDFPTPDTGFAATTAGIWRSLDGGTSWSLILPASDTLHPRGVVLNAMHFWSRSEGIVGGTYYPNISKTQDGGNSFARKEMFVSVEGFDFPTPDTGYAAGWNGTIWRSTNRGESWQKMSQRVGNSLKVQALEFISPRAGLAVFSDGQIHAYRSDAPVGGIPLRGPKTGVGHVSDWTRPTWSGFDGLGRRSPQGSTSEGTMR